MNNNFVTESIESIEQRLLKKITNFEFQESDESYVKINKKELKYLTQTKKIDSLSQEFLFGVMNYLCGKFNVLYDKDLGILNQTGLSKLLGVDTRTIRKNLPHLLESKLMYKLQNKKDSIYLINPYLMNYEDTIDFDLIYLFDAYGYKPESMSDIHTFVHKSKSNSKVRYRLEKDIERYLSADLNIIESGMRLVKTQYEVADGIIDILARDINDVLCIIELKAKKDDHRLTQQSVYYPTQFEERTRMITICPDYSAQLLESLKTLDGVELKQYYYNNEEELLVRDFIQ